MESVIFLASLVVNKYTTLLQSTANCKKAFCNPPVIAYRCNTSLRDLLVHSTLPHENSSGQQPAGIKKMRPPTLPYLFFSSRGSNELYFFTTNEARKITDSISCHSKNLVYLIECKRCHLQYIGETKRQLRENRRLGTIVTSIQDSKPREKQISQSFSYCELINLLRNGTIVRCL